MNSLFAAPDGVRVGDRFVDIALDAEGTPHPMRVVTVASIDDTGMIRLVSNIAGLSKMDRTVSAATLRREYRESGGTSC